MLENQFFQFYDTLDGAERAPRLYAAVGEPITFVAPVSGTFYMMKNGLQRVAHQFAKGDVKVFNSSGFVNGDRLSFMRSFSQQKHVLATQLPNTAINMNGIYYQPINSQVLHGIRIMEEYRGFTPEHKVLVTVDASMESMVRGQLCVIESKINELVGVFVDNVDSVKQTRSFYVDSDDEGMVGLDICFGMDIPDSEAGSIDALYSVHVTMEEVDQSSTFVFQDKQHGLAHLRYRCYEDEFGFPFQSKDMYADVWLPIIVRNPQPTQDEEVYTTLDGRNIVLFSEVGKEYECETDYLPEEWHDKLAIALACDEVYIDGKLLSKSDKYQINWEEKDVTDCGFDVAKAAFKMKENVVKRNSNY